MELCVTAAGQLAGAAMHRVPELPGFWQQACLVPSTLLPVTTASACSLRQPCKPGYHMVSCLQACARRLSNQLSSPTQRRVSRCCAPAALQHCLPRACLACHWQWHSQVAWPGANRFSPLQQLKTDGQPTPKTCDTCLARSRHQREKLKTRQRDWTTLHKSYTMTAAAARASCSVQVYPDPQHSAFLECQQQQEAVGVLESAATASSSLAPMLSRPVDLWV